VTARPALPPPLPGLDPDWSRLVDVCGADGVRTWHVLDNGARPSSGTLLCVHGNPTWSYLWRHVLAAAPPGWRVVAVDQLGMGYSDRTATPRGLAQRVEDLGDLTRTLGLDGPVVTLAHDWGGPVSLGWALAHRQQLRGVVLTNTAVHHPEGTAVPALIRLARSGPLRASICVRTPAFVRTTTALSRPPLPADVRDAFAAPYAGAGRRRGVGDFVADIPLSPDHPSAPALHAISAGLDALADVPALLLWGGRDPVFSDRYLHDLLLRLPHAQLQRYENASHLVTEDAPQSTHAIARWLVDLDAPPRGDPPAHRPAETGRSLGAALTRRSKDAAVAVVNLADRGRAVSFATFCERVGQVAAGLTATGVRRGDRVALLIPPSPDLTAATYAVWRAGAAIVVADRGLGLAGMGRAMRSARPDHVIGTVAGLAAARAMRVPGRRIAAGPVDRVTLRALGARHGLADLARLGRAAAAPDPSADPNPDEECAVVFTSGATGPAKGVVYLHRQVQAQLELLRSTYGLTDQDRLIAAFAPFALFGPALGIGSAVPDMDVTSPGTLTAVALADAAAAVDATVVFASPAALRNVVATAADLGDSQREALARLRLVMSAGAPLPPRLLRRVADLAPNARVCTPYGMTEVLPVTDVSLEEIETAGDGNGVCVGHSLPGVEIAVSALGSDGAAVAPLTAEPGVRGEVAVRAAHVKERYDALWATERESSRDAGWHRTGDVGHLDEAGRLWIEGRLAHVITTAAGVVTPIGLEQRAEALTAVRAAAAVGVGPAGVQQVVVVVVPNEPRPGSRWRRSALQKTQVLAGTDLAEAVRAVAELPVAAVLVRSTLPVDIRHASKVDRQALGRWATQVLSGASR